MPETIAEQLERSWVDVEALGELGGGTVVSRGISYCTAFEIALKIRELSGLLVEAYSAADLLHGPVAAIGRGCPFRGCTDRACPARAPPGGHRIERRGARIIAVSDDEELCARASVALPLVPGSPSGSARSSRSFPASWPPCGSRASAASTSTTRWDCRRSRSLASLLRA